MYKYPYPLIFCLLMIGCTPSDKFYIPIHNQKGSANPLSQKDIIRVIMPQNFQQNNNTIVANNALTAAKIITDHQLQSLGYTVIDGGYNPRLINHAVNWENNFEHQYTKNIIDFQLKQLGATPGITIPPKAKSYLLNQHQQLSSKIEYLRSNPKMLETFDNTHSQFKELATNKIIIDQKLEQLNSFPKPTVITVINATQERITQPTNDQKLPLNYQTHHNNLNQNYYKISYDIKLFRPDNTNSPLLACNNNVQSLGYCLATTEINSAPIIFTGHGSLITNSHNINADLGFLVYATLHNYPMIGIKKVYYNNIYTAQYHLTHIEN